jgi:hypothetical protein
LLAAVELGVSHAPSDIEKRESEREEHGKDTEHQPSALPGGFSGHCPYSLAYRRLPLAKAIAAS